MAKTAKNILSLNHEEVMDFFMKSEHYHGFELPEYFTFDEALKQYHDERWWWRLRFNVESLTLKVERMSGGADV